MDGWGGEEGTLVNTSVLLGESQAGIKISVRNINNFRYANDTTLMAESKEELKSLLMKVKEESEKGKKCQHFWGSKESFSYEN